MSRQQNKNEIIIVPQGGIANRMRAMMSAYTLAQSLGRRLRILWVENEELHCSFPDIFAINNDLYSVESISNFKHLFAFLPPLKKNLFLSPLFRLFKNRHYIFQIGKNVIFPTREQWLKEYDNQDIVIVSGSSFFDYDPGSINSVFPISDKVAKREKEIVMNQMPQIAFHIRRTDNTLAIKHSPLELFENALERELTNNSDALFFLATDDETIKNKFVQKYPHNIICNPNPAVRSTCDGIVDGMAELEILSKCEIIYGSYWSSFAEIASQKNGNRLVVLKT